MKENWICTKTRHYAEPNINILLTRNLPFHSDVKQWSHPFLIPLHFLCAKSNNSEVSAKWKEVKGKSNKINELIIKRKGDLKEGITYNSHPWNVFSFNLLVIIGRRGGGGRSLEIGRPRWRRWKNFGRRWTRGVLGLENWIIFMDVICVSSLNVLEKRNASL